MMVEIVIILLVGGALGCVVIYWKRGQKKRARIREKQVKMLKWLKKETRKRK